MIGITAALSLAGALAAFLLSPVWSVFSYFLLIFYYPQALTLPMGTIEFSSGRIMILGVVANALLRGGNLRRFRWNVIDLWLGIHFILMGIGFMVNVDPTRVLIGRGGAIFDTLLPYLAVRLLINDKQKLYSLLKLCTAGLVPLALAGIYEAKTGHNVYSPFAPYLSWGLGGPTMDPTYMRHGLFRASSSLGNYISFGMLFGLMAPLTLGLWMERNWSKAATLLVFGGLMIGAVSSMSSGPLSSLIVAIGMISMFKWRDKWPLFAMLFFAGLVFVEVFSNRHFYYVLTIFAFDQETAYYRIGLIEECFGGGMSGHWLFGYGYVGVGPGNDNANFNWEHQDLTNIYIHILARAGLIALIPFLVVNYFYYRRLFEASHIATELRDKWFIWCFAASLVGWNFAMQTVSALAQIETLLYMLIALCANMPAIMRQGKAAAGTEEEQEAAPPHPARPARRLPRRRRLARPATGPPDETLRLEEKKYHV